MIVNISKTKEIVFQRPSLKHFLAPSALCDIEQVSGAKLLGVIFKNNFSFDEQLFLNVVVSVLIYLNYFGTRVCCRCIWILYFIHLLCQRFDMLCVLGGGFLTQIQKGMINAFLRRTYKYHFVSECFDIDSIVDDMDRNFLRCCFPQSTFSTQSKAIRTGSVLETTTFSFQSATILVASLSLYVVFFDLNRFFTVFVCLPDYQFLFFMYVLVFILHFLPLLCRCF